MNKDILSNKNYISIGKIIKPHGVKGFLKFLLYNGDSSILLNRESLIIGKSLESVELEVEIMNLNSNILLLKFFDVDDRNDAEKYRDYARYIHRSELVRDEDDLFLVDLIGCDLFFDKNKVGPISDIVSYSGNDLLKVVGSDNKEHLIPINKELIELFDIEGRKLVIKTIEGILDIC